MYRSSSSLHYKSINGEWKDKSVSAADLSRLLKTQPPTTHIPIILMTAYALVNEQQYLLKTSQIFFMLNKFWTLIHF
jgi:CheY-like chemotaxis protein